MPQTDAVAAVITDHPASEVAVRKFALAGIDVKHLSAVGKRHAPDKKAVGM